MPLFEIKLYTAMSDAQFGALKQEIQKMSEALDRLEREMEETKVSVREYIDRTNVLIEELRANADNPERVNKVADELDALQAELAPAAPAPEPTPEPAPEQPTEEIS